MMPLNPATLTAEVLKLTDPSAPDFYGFPADAAAAAANWARAAKVYFREMVVPPVPPPAFDAGETAFAAAVATALAPGTAAVALAAGFTQFVLVLAAAAVPPVAVPPPPTLVIPVGPPTADPVTPAANLAAAVFAWTKTGMYGVPPQPPSVPWS